MDTISKFKGNPPLPEDAAIAEEFSSAVQTVADIMNRADRQGLICSFDGIARNAQNKFVVNNIRTLKLI